MNKLKTFCLTAVLALLTSVCSAEYESTTFPKELLGAWENMAGEKLNVGEQTVEHYKLVGIEKCVGGSESGGMLLDMDIDGVIKKCTMGYKLRPNYAVLAVNGQPYYRFCKAHFESVNGIYLGMTARELEALMGKPDLIDGNPGYNRWLYKNKDLEINFFYELVTEIGFTKKSSFKLDRSGLGGDAALEAYGIAYKDDMNWDERVKLSRENKMPMLVIASARNSEYIWIDENSIHLSSFAY